MSRATRLLWLPVLATGLAVAACGPADIPVRTGGASAEDPQPQRVLFVRGGPGSVGFLEGGADENASDVANLSSVGGTHGFGALAGLLTANGYGVTQWVEGEGGSSPVELTAERLEPFDVVVFASNNADYGDSEAEAVGAFVRDGGGVLFLSDANWGSSYSDAPTSDQALLTQFDLRISQDNGVNEGHAQADYREPDHPLLEGVSGFDGFGVSSFQVLDDVEGVDPFILVASSSEVFPHAPTQPGEGRGSAREPTDGDAALVKVEVDEGRVVGFMDRDTFFNAGGGATNLFRLDNQQLALNIFDWLAQRTEAS